MQQRIKLVNGKFVVEGEEEVKPEKPKIVPKKYSEEVIALRDRVIKGNQKLYDAWLQIKEMDHKSEEWSAQMDRWNEAQERLHILCLELKYKGYEDCLYLTEEGKRLKSCLHNPDGFWCQVCPSIKRYWEEEFTKL